MKTPVNGRTLRQHLTYSWWKYALVIILGALAVNLYYSVSAYKSPANKKIEMYVYGVTNEGPLNDLMKDIQESELPDMEEVHSVMLTTDETYGPMQIMTYAAAAEGDIYILPRDQFVSMASSGAWVALEDIPEITSLFTSREISLQSGWRREAESGKSHLYGIPVSNLPGLENYVYVENGYVSVLSANGNDENVLKFLRIFCERMLEGK